jgi:hypothetical protein
MVALAILVVLHQILNKGYGLLSHKAARI